MYGTTQLSTVLWHSDMIHLSNSVALNPGARVAPACPPPMSQGLCLLAG